MSFEETCFFFMFASAFAFTVLVVAYIIEER